jgi:hypothetical protein
MKISRIGLSLFFTFCVFTLNVKVIASQDKPAASTVPVHMVITDQAFNDSDEIPTLRPEAIQVKRGKTTLKVETLIPAQGENAALQLFVLIDDTVDPRIGTNLNELKDFINAQPASTVVGVAYMSNATIQITQNFTADHTLAANAVRLPRGTSSAMDSPYLSLISLVKGWPEQKVRREVLVITDGIDRLRAERLSSPRVGRGAATPMPGPSTLPTISPDADSASTISQRYGVIVHGIYAVGAGRLGRSAWEAQLGQSGISKIADETGGEYFALGTQNAVSFKPYLDRLQRIFNNQYYLVFRVAPGKKDGLQRIKVSTDVPSVDIAAADNVWVPAGK